MSAVFHIVLECVLRLVVTVKKYRFATQRFWIAQIPMHIGKCRIIDSASGTAHCDIISESKGVQSEN